jgi:hypothetical protein
MPREPSAAEAIYGHLRSQLPERPTQRSSSNSLAASMYPAHVKPRPIPEDAFERHMHFMGLVRKDGSRR